MDLLLWLCVDCTMVELALPGAQRRGASSQMPADCRATAWPQLWPILSAGKLSGVDSRQCSEAGPPSRPPAAARANKAPPSVGKISTESTAAPTSAAASRLLMLCVRTPMSRDHHHQRQRRDRRIQRERQAFLALQMRAVQQHRQAAHGQQHEQERRHQQRRGQVLRDGAQMELDAGADEEERDEPAEAHGVDLVAQWLGLMPLGGQADHHACGKGAENVLEAELLGEHEEAGQDEQRQAHRQLGAGVHRAGQQRHHRGGPQAHASRRRRQ